MIPALGGSDPFKGIGLLDLAGVKEWLFCPGMLFQSRGKWWGDRGARPRPHEGLDLLLYQDQEGRILRLTEATAVQAVFDGVVVGIIPDFLGRSVIVEHASREESVGRVYAIYAHIRPMTGISPGTDVRRGDRIAVIALPDRAPFPMAPHLHLSIAWSARPIPEDQFNWNTIGVSNALVLMDPLRVVACPHRLLGKGDPACVAL